MNFVFVINQKPEWQHKSTSLIGFQSLTKIWGYFEICTKPGYATLTFEELF